MPASVAARGLTGFRIADTVFGALAQIAPDRVFACEAGGDTGVSYGGYDADSAPFVFVEFVYGGWGGRSTRDGVDACSSSVVNFANNPVEVVEAEYPLLIHEYAYVEDTGGPGQHRGSLAVARAYEFRNAIRALQLRTDRQRFRPYGLAGGMAGTTSSNVLVRDGFEQHLPAKATISVRRGDRFRHVVAGAGGWGDPIQRDVERIEHDIREEKLSVEYAERAYHVQVDRVTGAVRRPGPSVEPSGSS